MVPVAVLTGEQAVTVASAAAISTKRILEPSLNCAGPTGDITPEPLDGGTTGKQHGTGNRGHDHFHRK